MSFYTLIFLWLLFPTGYFFFFLSLLPRNCQGHDIRLKVAKLAFYLGEGESQEVDLTPPYSQAIRRKGDENRGETPQEDQSLQDGLWHSGTSCVLGLLTL